MTYQRFIKRNRLTGGGNYVEPPADWPAKLGGAHINIDAEFCGFRDLESLARAYRSQHAHLIETHNDFVNRAVMMAGDLRRLEKDAVDEKSICAHIAHETDLDGEVVAAVLKEFFAW